MAGGDGPAVMRLYFGAGECFAGPGIVVPLEALLDSAVFAIVLRVPYALELDT